MGTSITEAPFVPTDSVAGNVGLSNQSGHNTQTDLRLIFHTAVHGQLVSTILLQAGSVSHCDRCHAGHHIGQGAISSRVFHGIADLYVLQAVESGAATTIVASQSDVAQPTAGAVEVRNALIQRSIGSALVDVAVEVDGRNGEPANGAAPGQ